MTAASQAFDLIVIGGGPGGYVAAIRASQLGMKVALVEREHLGGICLNWGCIPTKALLRSAEVYRTMQHAEAFGIKAEKISFDLKAIVARSRAVSSQLSQGIGHLMKKHKVTVFEGHGKLNGKLGNAHNVTIRETAERDAQRVVEIHASHVIIATGARARIVPGLEPDGQQIVTYKNAMVPDALPKKLLVIGSGAIGIEFASFYNALGVDVTVVEMQPRILPVEDVEISQVAHKAFEQQGMTIHTNTVVKDVKKSKKDLKVVLDSDGKETTLSVDKVITAIGIVPNTEDLGLESTNITFTKGHINSNKWCETDEPGIYAIGDVVQGPWLAHKASHEGVLCVEKIAGKTDLHPIDNNAIPGCTYCTPQIASVGLTEQQAQDAGHDIKVGRFPFLGNGKAIAMGEPEGLVKTIFDRETGELLGAHMVGAEVTELIQGYVIGKTLEATEKDFTHTIFPHPTLSEMMHEAVLDADDTALHI